MKYKIKWFQAVIHDITGEGVQNKIGGSERKREREGGE
jgi:hypothetical protein